MRRRTGVDNLFGVTDDNGRNQYNIKIDQNFSQKHKASASWTYERTDSDDWMSPNHWPSAFRGHHQRRPQVWTSSFTSALSSTLLNEARFGVRRNTTGVLSSLDNPATAEGIKQYLPTINNKLVQIVLGTGTIGGTGVNFPSIIGTTGTGIGNSLGDITSLWTWADSICCRRPDGGHRGRRTGHLWSFGKKLQQLVQARNPGGPDPARICRARLTASGQSNMAERSNNFGPAFGFAYQLPWFGKDKTTLRGGYQATYQGGGRFNELEGPVGNPPGTSYGASVTQLGGANTYLDLTDLPVGVPVPPAILPMQPLPITDRTQS